MCFFRLGFGFGFWFRKEIEREFELMLLSTTLRRRKKGERKKAEKQKKKKGKKKKKKGKKRKKKKTLTDFGDCLFQFLFLIASYPKKNFICVSPISVAAPVIKPEITECDRKLVKKPRRSTPTKV